MALRTLEESASLARRMADRAEKRGHTLSARRFHGQVQEAEHRAEVIRRVLLNGISAGSSEDRLVRDI